MYFEYASLCMLWNWLIYLMPIYCCFYVSWFCFTNWKQIKGMKTCCLSNVKQAMDQHFYNSCYSLHLCFAVLALGDNFRKKKKKKQQQRDIHFIVFTDNILCFTVSYLIRCVVVTTCKMIFLQRVSKSWQKQKRSQSHNLPSISSLAHCNKSRKFKEYRKYVCRKFKKCRRLVCRL